MRRMWNFFKDKGFYMALGIGLVAFATLLAVYNYTDIGNELTKERGIDLNQPVADNEDEKQKESVAANTNPVKKMDEEKNNGEKKQATEEQVAENITEGAKNSKNQNIVGSVNGDVAENTNGNVNITEASGETNVEDIANVTSEENVEDTADAPSENDNLWSDETTELVPSLEYDGEQYLVWPVVGNVILPFSMETTVYFQTLDMYKCNPGMLIQGEEGLDVISAYEGVVESVEDTKEYGTVVKVNMGNGYEAIYGQMMNVCVKKGDNVSIAGAIGEIAPPSKYYTKEGPHLYFAITKDGKPVNPINLIQ